MIKEQAKEIFEKEVMSFCKEKVSLLGELYELPTQELKEQENQTLSGIALGIMYDLGNLIPKVLDKAGVKYSQTVWGDIQSKLSPLSFRYIDWDSFRVNELSGQQQISSPKKDCSKDTYQRKITAQDAKGFIKNGTLLIPAGGLGVGSIVCLTLHIGSKPIWVIGLVAATATAGYVVFQNVFADRVEPQRVQGLEVPQTTIHQKSTINKVIDSTCMENRKILVDWGKKLTEELLVAWEEAEKK